MNHLASSPLWEIHAPLPLRARAATLTHYREIARHIGLDPYAMLRQAQLHPSILEDPENWVPARNVLSLLEESALRAGRDDFGILLGECRTFASLGPVSLLLKHESNLRDTIASMIEYRRLINELLHLHLRCDGQSSVLEWNLIPGLRSSQGINLLAAISYRVLALEGQFSWQPECIHFRHSAPLHLSTFKRVFCCELEFDSDFDGMSFSSVHLELPNRFADSDLATHAKRLLNLMPSIRVNESIATRTRSAIPLLLSDGQANAASVADFLGISVRTFQRRLIKEGESFSRLLNEIRRELAMRYLIHSNQSITGIAHALGYSALSAFTRWFVSEFRIAPAKWRELNRRAAVQAQAGTFT